MEEIESIERATLAAVPPAARAELPGWLLGLDGGTVGRCHSAVPLAHAQPAAGLRQEVEACYALYGLPAVWRLPRHSAFEIFSDGLQGQGYRPTKPTLVQTGSIEAMAGLASGPAVQIADRPDARWGEVFLGEGFDPVDGASRLAILGRSTSTLFASVEVDGRLAAVGSACLSHGWCGIHGMRTLPQMRGRGLARAILAALARQSQARGFSRAFLQVEEGNAPARALYRRAGLRQAWAYAYWARCA